MNIFEPIQLTASNGGFGDIRLALGLVLLLLKALYLVSWFVPRSPRGTERTEAEKAALNASVHASVINIGEFRLEHARQTDPDRYTLMCTARGIKPDFDAPAPTYYTGDYRDWAAATINKLVARHQSISPAA